MEWEIGGDHGRFDRNHRHGGAQYHLRQVFVFRNMFPINQPEVMIGNATDRFDAEGNLTDETVRKLIRQLLQILVDWTRRIAQT